MKFIHTSEWQHEIHFSCRRMSGSTLPRQTQNQASYGIPNKQYFNTYKYLTTQHQPSAPIQECHYGAFFKMKGHAIHHSINEQDCRWWNDAISTHW